MPRPNTFFVCFIVLALGCKEPDSDRADSALHIDAGRGEPDAAHGSTDSGLRDATPDAAIDAGADSGTIVPDAATEVAMDAGPDAAAEIDAGPDASLDGGPGICGDGVVEAPEECDHAGTSRGCDRWCHVPCFECPCELCDTCDACIHSHPDLGPFDRDYCGPLCQAVKECVIRTGCYLPIAAACYCGPDTDGDGYLSECEAADFVPIGPCIDVIRAGLAGPDAMPFDNGWVIEHLGWWADYPAAAAMELVNAAQTECTEPCGL